MRRWIALLGVLTGCAISQGPVGVIGPSADVFGTKLLRSGTTGHSCRTRVLGVPLRAGAPELREALAEMLAQDEEADVVLNADVRSWALMTGLYNRRCLEVRGDLSRVVPTIALPGSMQHGSHGDRH